MSYDYTITEEEFRNRSDIDLLRCSTQCGHFDELNQCCWKTWWHKNEGDLCDFGLYDDGRMQHVKGLWKKKNPINTSERRTPE